MAQHEEQTIVAFNSSWCSHQSWHSKACKISDMSLFLRPVSIGFILFDVA